jgi:hypothetical protein
LIDYGSNAWGGGGDVLGGEAGGIVGHLACEGDDAVLGHDVYGGGFQQGLGVKLGLDAGGDGVIAGLVAGECEQEQERKSNEKQFPSKHKALQSLRRQQRWKKLREFPDPRPLVRCWTEGGDDTRLRTI